MKRTEVGKLISMKILTITEEGRGGGALFRILEVNRELRMQGIDVKVVYPNTSDLLQEALAKNNIPGVPIRLHRLTLQFSHLLWYILFFPIEIWALIQLLKKEKCDVLHCNGSWQIKGIIAAYFTSTASIWHLNDTYQPFAVRLLFRWIAPLADAFIVASQRTNTYYANIYPKIESKVIRKIPTSVDHGKFAFAPLAPPELCKFVVSTIGYVNENKGLETLIKAITICNAKGFNAVSYQIIGPVLPSQNAYFQKLERLIMQLNIANITFLGYCENVVEELKRTHIYVCPSIRESSPRALWEAMSMGKVVISTDVGDVVPLFKSENCGFHVPIENAAALADKLLYCFDAYPNLNAMQMAARKAVQTNFDLCKIVKAHLELYVKLSGKAWKTRSKNNKSDSD